MTSLRGESEIIISGTAELTILRPSLSPSITRQSRVFQPETRDCRAFYFSSSGMSKAAAGGWGRPA